MRARILIAAWLPVLACSSPEPQERAVEEGVVPVHVQRVEQDRIPITASAVGTTVSHARATPGTRIMGRVAEVGFSEGDRVKRGQVLVRIENQDLLARRRQAESARQEARAVLENAEKNVQRLRNLFQEKAVSQQALDEAETGYARARAGVAATEEGILEVEANLRYSAVESPLDGVIVQKLVQPGDMAAPGTPLFAVEQQDPIEVTLEVSERDLPHVEVGREVVVEIVALKGAAATRTGRVQALIPAADPGSRTFRVKVVVPNPGGAIGSGMFARVQFPKGERPALLVPASAVVRQGQLEGVYVVTEGRSRLRWVRLGRAFGDRVEVVAGLDEGEDVVISDVARVGDGRRVEVLGDA